MPPRFGILYACNFFCDVKEMNILHFGLHVFHNMSSAGALDHLQECSRLSVALVSFIFFTLFVQKDTI